ncbi:alpha/beta hydrolase [Arthrobacter sp. H35-D1]|uniref:alpha/beta fold hydrolase n=1 Tax=Arthrobacter sp. H35-D1 TaxID=3046202 RepID=UPI0024BA295D|nr:alpha/beta hydrolase [Arthrobacter sp. H35-D1]MDJ0313823.1 alpha/beta hydrolase [Arthrobacter sp. H35-D1]
MSKTRIVFVHGMDGYGAAAWPAQHFLAGNYDCLFIKRTGFNAVEPPAATDFGKDARLVIDELGDGGHVVAHAQGAIAAMMAAVQRPDLVRSLVLLEPLLLSLTAELPATAAYSVQLGELFAHAKELSDNEFLSEFNTLMAIAATPGTETVRRLAARARLQLPSTQAPLHIVPGVPTTVITGGWEPLYEEVAQYLGTTGARHIIQRSGHRPQDTAGGAALIEEILRAADARTA